MPFNPNRPYGTVVGHAYASFEQDGVLYDIEGEPLGGGPEIIEAAQTRAAIPAPSDALTFLRDLLSGGPVDKSAVYREVELQKQNWDDVRSAFLALSGSSYKLKGTTYWRLPSEVIAKE